MKKTYLRTTVFVAFTLVMTETSHSASAPMEKCKIIGSDGKSLIKAGMADCAAGGGTSCAGSNKEGDPEAWVYLPRGACGKIKGGNTCK